GGGAAHHPPDEPDPEEPEQDGDREGIDVQHPEAPVLAAKGLGEEGQMMLDVSGGSELSLGGHGCRASILSIKKSQSENQHRHQERSDEHADDRLVVAL